MSCRPRHGGELKTDCGFALSVLLVVFCCYYSAFYLVEHLTECLH